MRLALITLLAAACGNLTGLEDRTPYTDSAYLFSRWNHVEACSGLTGDYTRVRFFTTDALTRKGKPIVGIWLSDSNEIVVVGHLRMNDMLIDHEIMHALLQGGEDHPVRYFNGACGDLMALAH